MKRNRPKIRNIASREERSQSVDRRYRSRIQSNIKRWNNANAYAKVEKRVSLDKLNEYCSGKTVLIVGNSKEIISSGYGGQIDSYDIVIRLNHGHIKKEFSSHMGRKYNIWAHGFSSHALQKKEYKSIRNTVDYHIATNVCKLNVSINDGKCFVVNNMWYKSPFEVQNKVEMSTGMNAIYLFCDKVISYKSLSIVGFDFMRTNNLALSSVKARFHNSDLEERCIKEKLILNDKYLAFNDKYRYI